MTSNLTRREMLGLLAGASAALNRVLAANDSKPARIGIGMHSYGGHWTAARNRSPQARFHDALTFLEYAQSMGAAGVQVSIGNAQDDAYAKKIRSKAETDGLYFEGQTTLPKGDGDTARFEKDVQSAKAAGATIIRTAMLGGRRYETFDTAQAFRDFAARSWKSLTLAEPILKQHRVRLALENHKDWLVGELLDILRRISSEHVGICVDTGNSIALLEDPMAVVEAYAPFAASVHIKDMAVAEYEEGFLLSEVPLGQGFLDLPRIIQVLRAANPSIQFNLEMITRDPLKVPCVTGEKYWATFEKMPASQLASMLALVKAKAAKEELPRTTGLSPEQRLAAEDGNVRKSIEYARAHLGL
jgi:sugar phosphate isomerase/epimerase